MTKTERKQQLLAILKEIGPGKTQQEVVAILSRLITEVGSMRFVLDDMPLVTGALNLLVSSVVLDYGEKEEADYEWNTALKTIVDMELV